jgi:hypothetical protein
MGANTFQKKVSANFVYGCGIIGVGIEIREHSERFSKSLKRRETFAKGRSGCSVCDMWRSMVQGNPGNWSPCSPLIARRNKVG